MKTIPFPPYKPSGAGLRFPNDERAQQKIFLLRAWLVDKQLPNALTVQANISQRTIYRFRTSWQDQGIEALLSTPKYGHAKQPQVKDVRTLLKMLGQQGSFAVGSSREGAYIAPQIKDPAHRGRLLSSALRGALHQADAALNAEHGAPHILANCFLTDEAAPFPKQSGALIHPRDLNRLLEEGLQALICNLHAWLTQPVVWPWTACHEDESALCRQQELEKLSQSLSNGRRARLTGLAGVGKSTLAAQLAQEWMRAGWNVLWASCSLEGRTRPLDSFIADLHRQLAAFGALRTARPDDLRLESERLRTVSLGLKRLPTLLIIDDIHLGLNNKSWINTLNAILNRCESTAVLLVGEYCPLGYGPELYLEGLTLSESLTFYRRQGGVLDRKLLKPLHKLTGGNPLLLQLAASHHSFETYSDELKRVMLRSGVNCLNIEARRLLAWLSWEKGPLDWSHPFVKSAKASEESWDSLIQYNLITIQGNRILVNDLVRDNLTLILSDDEWKRTARAVQDYAERSAIWDLACRCAAACGNKVEVLCFSQRAAQTAEKSGDLEQGLFWWNLAQTEAVSLHDSEAEISAQLGKATCLLRLARPNEALKILDAMPSCKDLTEGAWRALVTVRALGELGHLQEAFTRLMNIPRSSFPPEEIEGYHAWLIRLEQIFLCWRQGRLTQAWINYQQLGLPPAGLDEASLDRFYKIGASVALGQAKYTLYERLSKILIHLTQKRLNPYTICEAHIERAEMFIKCERFLQAKSELELISATVDDQWLTLHAKAAMSRASLSYQLGDMQTSQYWQKVALKIYSGMGLPSEIAAATLQAGDIAYFCGNFKDARTAYEAALEIYRACSFAEGQTVSYINLARLEISSENITDAKCYLSSALKIIGPCNLQRCFLLLRIEWANLYWLLADWPHALRHYSLAACEFNAKGLHISMAKAQIRVAECLLRLGRIDEADEDSAYAAEIIQRLPCGLRVGPHIWLARAQLLEAQGDLAEAHTAHRQAWASIQWQAQHLPDNISG